jgi:hypothetical protein
MSPSRNRSPITVKLRLVELLVAGRDIVRRRRREKVAGLESDHVRLAGHLFGNVASF